MNFTCDTDPQKIRKSEPIVIVYSSDKKFETQLTVAIYSTIRNLASSRKVIIYLLDGGLSKFFKTNVEKIVGNLNKFLKIIILKPSIETVEKCRLRKGISRAAYLRLLIPELLPKNINKAIYLDSDIVVEHDIEELWNNTFDNNAIMAVQDPINYNAQMHLGYILKEMNIEPKALMFNSGVMVIDLDYWRKKNIGKKVIEYCTINKDRMLLCDQDGLNAILNNNWKILDPRWNQMRAVHSPNFWNFNIMSKDWESIKYDLINKPKIIHFTGRDKPWKFGCSHKLKHRYHYYLRESRAYSRLKFLLWIMCSYIYDVVILLKASGKIKAYKYKKKISRKMKKRYRGLKNVLSG